MGAGSPIEMLVLRPLAQLLFTSHISSGMLFLQLNCDCDRYMFHGAGYGGYCTKNGKEAYPLVQLEGYNVE